MRVQVDSPYYYYGVLIKRPDQELIVRRSCNVTWRLDWGASTLVPVFFLSPNLGLSPEEEDPFPEEPWEQEVPSSSSS